MLEVVSPALTLLEIMRRGSGTSKSGFLTSTKYLSTWLRSEQKGDRAFEAARERFMLSNAGYCVVQYVLGLGDRHPSNIMVKPNGNLFHIDFGHFLGNFKKAGGVLRETAGVAFTEAHLHLLGGRESLLFKEFIVTSCKAFMILRKNADIFVGLLSMMLSTGIPELQTADDIR